MRIETHMEMDCGPDFLWCALRSVDQFETWHPYLAAVSEDTILCTFGDPAGTASRFEMLGCVSVDDRRRQLRISYGTRRQLRLSETYTAIRYGERSMLHHDLDGSGWTMLLLGRVLEARLLPVLVVANVSLARLIAKSCDRSPVPGTNIHILRPRTPRGRIP